MSRESPAAELVSLSDDGRVLSLTGELTFANAHDYYRDLSRLLQEGVEQIDCSGLSHADSTALSLLLGGAGAARERQQALQITGLSSRLQSLAQVYGIEELLGLEVPSDPGEPATGD